MPVLGSAVPFDRSSGIRNELGPHSISSSCIVQRLIELYKSAAACRSYPTSCNTDTAGVKIWHATIL